MVRKMKLFYNFITHLPRKRVLRNKTLLCGAAGGSRTHMGQAHAILSRARKPIPPPRLNFNLPYLKF